jgi:NAD(P)-dependent dehydrogenase (short-subunit alcohol dehydrogenase family)
MTIPTYAVTGASGQLGRLAVQELLARGVPASDVVAPSCAPRGEADDLAERGVQMREADYSRPPSRRRSRAPDVTSGLSAPENSHRLPLGSNCQMLWI